MSDASQQPIEPTRGIQPQPEDVLCGKDKHCVHAPGSIRFRTIIDSYRERYASSLTKFDKMQITKEIYETLSQTSRFLKYNAKEKTWEEISPMAARDKCGHALRFANRLKSKKKPAAIQDRSPSVTSAAPAPGVITPASSLSPTTMPAGRAPAQPQQASALPGMGQLQSQQPQVQLSSSSQPQTTTTTTAQQMLWGELLKRYDSMWNATQIPALAGIQAGSPVAAAAASLIRAAAAAGTIAAAPPQSSSSQLPSLMATQQAAVQALMESNGGALGANVTAAVAAAAAAAAGTTTSGVTTTTTTSAPGPTPAASSSDQACGLAASSGPPPTGQNRRKPTLDDLCSLLLAAKNTTNN